MILITGLQRLAIQNKQKCISLHCCSGRDSLLHLQGGILQCTDAAAYSRMISFSPDLIFTPKDIRLHQNFLEGHCLMHFFF